MLLTESSLLLSLFHFPPSLAPCFIKVCSQPSPAPIILCCGHLLCACVCAQLMCVWWSLWWRTGWCQLMKSCIVCVFKKSVYRCLCVCVLVCCPVQLLVAAVVSPAPALFTVNLKNLAAESQSQLRLSRNSLQIMCCSLSSMRAASAVINNPILFASTSLMCLEQYRPDMI